MSSIPQKEQIISTLNKVGVILKNIDRVRAMLDNKLATRFSIFQVLGGLSETEMSKILAHLLDPKGSHSQGDKFLKLFLKKFLQIRQENLDNDQQSRSSDNTLRPSPPKQIEINVAMLREVKIKTEDYTDKGRKIDITITGDSFIIGIENKLWAAEQTNQLKDYYEELNRRAQGVTDSQAVPILVFLCVDRGRAPKSMEDGKGRVKGGDLILINYEDHVIPWLRECVQVAESEKIRWYIEEIVHWVNKYCYWREDFMNDKNMLWDIVKESKDELNTMLYIQDRTDEVKRSFIKEYLEYIAEELRLKLGNSKWKVSQNVSDEPGQKPWTKSYHKPIVVNHSDIPIRAMLEFEYAGYGSPYYGINTDINPKMRFHADLLDALKGNYKQSLSNSKWPIFVPFESTDWMSPDFIIRLHDFHKNRENSELGRVANTVVANMLDMMKTVDAVVLSQK